MRILTKDEKVKLMQWASAINETASNLMEIEELRASAHNISELEHHLEHVHKYLNRIIKENA